MILSKRVSLNNVQLDELDERIVITGIDEAAGKDTISAATQAATNGQRITDIRRETLDVTVRFRMMIHKGRMSERSALLEKINGWAANGGWMRLNYRPGRRLLVTLAQAPGAGDMFNWTNEYSMVFRAYSVPYWMDNSETTMTGSVTAGGIIYMTVPGSAYTVLDISVENRSGKSFNNLIVKAVTSPKTLTMQYANLALGGSQTLTISHLHTQELFVMQNKIGSTSVLKARTPASADDFVVSPGNLNVQWAADRAVRVTVKCRGRYL